jgi:hypothetical protein
LWKEELRKEGWLRERVKGREFLKGGEEKGCGRRRRRGFERESEKGEAEWDGKRED